MLYACCSVHFQGVNFIIALSKDGKNRYIIIITVRISIIKIKDFMER